ncbi:MAG: hypothetical protein ABI587_17110 [Gemmatimonadales bacterium]
MNRVTRGMVVLAAALATVSCSGDPTDSLRNGIDHLIATPSALFIASDSTAIVRIEAVDAQGNRLAGNFTLGTIDPGLTIVEDSSFNLVRDTNGNLVKPANPTRVQYFVTSTGTLGTPTFTVTAGGKALTIRTRIAPSAASAITLSTAAANAGDTVTATAPANFLFTPASVVSAPGGATVSLGISPDSTQISFVVGPSISGSVTVSDLILTYAPSLGSFSSTSAGVLTTPAVTNITIGLSNGTPNVNDLVTVTAPAGIKFLPTATVSFGTDDQATISVAADSNSLVFRTHQAGASGVISVNDVALDFLTTVPFSTTTSATATVGATVTTLTGTDAIATAPLITIPLAGHTGGVQDGGQFFAAPECGSIGNHCKFYQFVLTGDRTFDVTINWGNTADLGGYFIDASGADQVGDFACDANGSGATAHPESCTTTLPAGTYFLALADFTGAAQNTGTVTIDIVGQ